jgi:antitoxin (DNA-binding transcriptional repressor) of toxin-antitoxin stability system
MKRLEAAELAEHFAEFLEQLHARRESVEILRQGVPYAYLFPVPGGCNTLEFADDLDEARMRDLGGLNNRFTL